MSEWPKRVLEWEVPGDRSATGPEVIPADLAQELYEAAREAPDFIKSDPQYGACYGPEDRGKGVWVVEKIDAALARYEQEVGK